MEGPEGRAIPQAHINASALVAQFRHKCCEKTKGFQTREVRGTSLLRCSKPRKNLNAVCVRVGCYLAAFILKKIGIQVILNPNLSEFPQFQHGISFENFDYSASDDGGS